jgi:hypothetical protein
MTYDDMIHCAGQELLILLQFSKDAVKAVPVLVG